MTWGGILSAVSTIHTKRVTHPQNVEQLAWYAAQWFSVAYSPKIGQSVKPTPPIRFHIPTCHPRTPGAGSHQCFCVSSVNIAPATTKPTPPMI